MGYWRANTGSSATAGNLLCIIRNKQHVAELVEGLQKIADKGIFVIISMYMLIKHFKY